MSQALRSTPSRAARLAFPLTAFALALGLAACGQDNPAPEPDAAPPAAPAKDTFVLTSGNKLLNLASTSTAASTVTTVNLAVPAGETLLGGDVRPVDGKLYLVTKAGTGGKLYTADVGNGSLTLVGTLTNASGGAPITLAGTKYGVDFNPIPDRLRVIGDNGENLRINPTAAANNTTVDAPISTGLFEAAYTNSSPTACQTDLYYINGTQLFLSAAPNGIAGNAATPRLVGNLGVTADAMSGFDVRTTSNNNNFVAALRVNGSYAFYDLDATTGKASIRNPIPVPAGETVVGIATLPFATLPTALFAGNMVAITGEAMPKLVTFNRPPQGSPAKLCSNVAITGLGMGEAIVGADTRPRDGKLYVLTKNGTVGKLYTLTTGGAATLVATLAADAADATNPYAGLSGTSFGVDFNPVPDRLRITSDTGQSLRVVVAAVDASGTAAAIPAGATTTDTNLNTGGADRTGVTAVAYTNSLFGGSGASLFTTLFGIDSASNALVRIGSDPGNGTAGDPGNPNSGVVTNVGNLTSDGTTAVDIGDANGFEIIGTTGAALLAGTVGMTTSLYTVNLASGTATAAGNFAVPIVAMGSNGAQTATVFGVTDTGNKLVSFSPATPGMVTAIGTITVGENETVLGLDYRPSIGPKNGQLVALSSAGKLYAVNPATGAATVISTLAGTGLTFVGANEHGVDFNPLPDRLRVVDTAGNNLRINVETGATTSDTRLSMMGVFGAGYTNNFTSAPSTQLYYLADAGTASTLQTTTAPNDGVLTPVGTGLGADFSTLGDLDITGGQNGFVLAALQPTAGGVSGLYRISLSAGTATKIADIATAGGEPVRGIAIRVQ